jgi:hypothetical protein
MDFQLSDGTINGLLVLAYVGGVALRIAWPFLLAYLQDSVKFDAKKVIGQIAAGLLGLLGVFASQSFLGDLGAVGYIGALAMGYGAASIGRDGQKTLGQITGR